MVRLIVKADDVGVALARYDGASVIGGAIRSLGRALVRGMPIFLAVLSTIGTAAMIWVGGGIILHGIEKYGPPAVGRTVHAATGAAAHVLPSVAGIIEWSVEAAISGVAWTACRRSCDSGGPIRSLAGMEAVAAIEAGLNSSRRTTVRPTPATS